MRYIFVDEAGTSAPEPVTVVVGIIADADQHVMNADELVIEALGSVPEKFKKDFVFHATEVFNDRKYHADWSMEDRLRLLSAMMSVPRKIGMAITVSAVWRDASNLSDSANALGVSPSQFQHILAFGYCLAVSDRNIRRYANPREVATVVAEDVPEMRRFLKKLPKSFRENPMHFTPQHLRETDRDKAAGHSIQSGELRITRIRNSVHFVEKDDDHLVQVADACAYGFRRYFAGEKFGDKFVSDILGNESLVKHFSSPAGTECWWPKS